MDEPLYGKSLDYEFVNSDFTKVVQSIIDVLLRQKDYYPVEATLSSLASNVKRYASNPMVLYRHDPTMISNPARRPHSPEHNLFSAYSSTQEEGRNPISQMC